MALLSWQRAGDGDTDTAMLLLQRYHAAKEAFKPQTHAHAVDRPTRHSSGPSRVLYPGEKWRAIPEGGSSFLGPPCPRPSSLLLRTKIPGSSCDSRCIVVLIKAISRLWLAPHTHLAPQPTADTWSQPLSPLGKPDYRNQLSLLTESFTDVSPDPTTPSIQNLQLLRNKTHRPQGARGPRTAEAVTRNRRMEQAITKSQ